MLISIFLITIIIFISLFNLICNSFITDQEKMKVEEVEEIEEVEEELEVEEEEDEEYDDLDKELEENNDALDKELEEDNKQDNYVDSMTQTDVESSNEYTKMLASKIQKIVSEDSDDEYKDMPPLVSSDGVTNIDEELENILDDIKSESDKEYKNLDTSDKIKKISISNIEDRNDNELKKLVRDLKNIIIKYNFNVEVDIFEI